MRTARRALPLEAVGFVFGSSSEAKIFVPLTNLAAEPSEGFEVDETEIAQALAQRPDGPLALFHSHPTDIAAPSRRDIDGARNWPDLYHLILSLAYGEQFRCWRFFRDQVYPITIVDPAEIKGETRR